MAHQPAGTAGLIDGRRTSLETPTGGCRLVGAGAGPAGGITTAADELPADYVIFSVVVGDVEATCKQITELGGSVMVGPASTPDGLRFANVADPKGNHFGIFTPPAAG